MWSGAGAEEGPRRQLNFGIPYSTFGPQKVDPRKNNIKLFFQCFMFLAFKTYTLTFCLNENGFRITKTIVVLFVATVGQNRDRVAHFCFGDPKTIVRCVNFENAFYRIIKNL